VYAGGANSQVDEVLKGSFDLHVHAGPDPGQERRLDALDTGRYAHEAEMAGFVLKSHHYPTAPLAHALNRIYPGLSVAGAIVLNREVGGLNPDAVQAAADTGARAVWMPTFSADAYLKDRAAGPGITLTDDDGALLGAVHDVMDIVHHHDMVLASGHVSPAEALQLFTTAKEKGIQRMLVTHPSNVATIEEIRQMADLGAYVEYTFLSCMPSVNESTPAQIASAVRDLGFERCVVTSDFGQWTNPPPAEGFRMAIAALLEAGLRPKDLSALVKTNPLDLIGPVL
jgi:hypothetical protein